MGFENTNNGTGTGFNSQSSSFGNQQSSSSKSYGSFAFLTKSKKSGTTTPSYSFGTYQNPYTGGSISESDWIKKKYQSRFSYGFDDADQARKATGETTGIYMPAANQAKYNMEDGRDKFYFDNGLPPMSEMEKYKAEFADYLDTESKKGRLYGTVTDKYLTLEGLGVVNDAEHSYYVDDKGNVVSSAKEAALDKSGNPKKVQGNVLYEQAFFNTLDSDDFADYKELYYFNTYKEGYETADRPEFFKENYDEITNDDNTRYIAEEKIKNWQKDHNDSKKIADNGYISFTDFTENYYDDIRKTFRSEKGVKLSDGTVYNGTYGDFLDAQLEGARDNAIAPLVDLLVQNSENNWLQNAWNGTTGAMVKAAKNKLIEAGREDWVAYAEEKANKQIAENAERKAKRAESVESMIDTLLHSQNEGAISIDNVNDAIKKFEADGYYRDEIAEAFDTFRGRDYGPVTDEAMRAMYDYSQNTSAKDKKKAIDAAVKEKYNFKVENGSAGVAIAETVSDESLADVYRNALEYSAHGPDSGYYVKQSSREAAVRAMYEAGATIEQASRVAESVERMDGATTANGDSVNNQWCIDDNGDLVRNALVVGRDYYGYSDYSDDQSEAMALAKRVAFGRYNSGSKEGSYDTALKSDAYSDEIRAELLAEHPDWNDFDIDQAFRRNPGYHLKIDDTSAAENYYKYDYIPSLLANNRSMFEGTEFEGYNAASQEEQRQMVEKYWNVAYAPSRDSVVEEFHNAIASNSSIDKSIEEQIGGAFTRIGPDVFLRIADGVVNFADMITGTLGNDENNLKWSLTNTLDEAVAAMTGLNRVEGMDGSGTINLVSDVVEEVLRMYVENAIGGMFVDGVTTAVGSTTKGAQFLEKIGKIEEAANAINADAKARSVTEGLSARLKAFKGDGVKIGEKLVSRKVLLGENMLINSARSLIHSVPFVTGAMGNYYSEALSKMAENEALYGTEYSYKEKIRNATQYGTVLGLMEGLVESLNADKIWGRIAGERQVAKQVFGASSLLRDSSLTTKLRFANLVASFFGEASEEGLGYVGSWWMGNHTLNKDNYDRFDLKEFSQNALMGGITGFVAAAFQVKDVDLASFMEEYGINRANIDVIKAYVAKANYTREELAQFTEESRILTRSQIDDANAMIDENIAVMERANQDLEKLEKEIGVKKNNLNNKTAAKEKAIARLDSFENTHRVVTQTNDGVKISYTDAEQHSKLKAAVTAALDAENKASLEYETAVKNRNTNKETFEVSFANAARTINSAKRMIDGHYIRLQSMLDADMKKLMTEAYAKRSVAEMKQANKEASDNLSDAVLNDEPNAEDIDTAYANLAANFNDTAGLSFEDTYDNIVNKVNNPGQETASEETVKEEGKKPVLVALQEDEKASVIRYAKEANIDVRFEVMPGTSRGYFDKNGGSDGKGVLVINSNQPSGMQSALKTIVMHEIVHAIQRSPVYNQYAQYVLDRMMMGEEDYSISDLIRAKKMQYAAYKKSIGIKGASISTEEAIHELVADYTVSHVIDNPDEIKALVDNLGDASTAISSEIIRSSAGITTDGYLMDAMNRMKAGFAKAFIDARISPSVSEMKAYENSTADEVSENVIGYAMQLDSLDDLYINDIAGRLYPIFKMHNKVGNKADIDYTYEPLTLDNEKVSKSVKDTIKSAVDNSENKPAFYFGYNAIISLASDRAVVDESNGFLPALTQKGVLFVSRKTVNGDIVYTGDEELKGNIYSAENVQEILRGAKLAVNSIIAANGGSYDALNDSMKDVVDSAREYLAAMEELESLGEEADVFAAAVEKRAEKETTASKSEEDGAKQEQDSSENISNIAEEDNVSQDIADAQPAEDEQTHMKRGAVFVAFKNNSKDSAPDRKLSIDEAVLGKGDGGVRAKKPKNAKERRMCEAAAKRRWDYSVQQAPSITYKQYEGNLLYLHTNMVESAHKDYKGKNIYISRNTGSTARNAIGCDLRNSNVKIASGYFSIDKTGAITLNKYGARMLNGSIVDEATVFETDINGSHIKINGLDLFENSRKNGRCSIAFDNGNGVSIGYYNEEFTLKVFEGYEAFYFNKPSTLYKTDFSGLTEENMYEGRNDVEFYLDNNLRDFDYYLKIAKNAKDKPSLAQSETYKNLVCDKGTFAVYSNASTNFTSWNASSTEKPYDKLSVAAAIHIVNDGEVFDVKTATTQDAEHGGYTVRKLFIDKETGTEYKSAKDAMIAVIDKLRNAGENAMLNPEDTATGRSIKSAFDAIMDIYFYHNTYGAGDEVWKSRDKQSRAFDNIDDARAYVARRIARGYARLNDSQFAQKANEDYIKSVEEGTDIYGYTDIKTQFNVVDGKGIVTSEVVPDMDIRNRPVDYVSESTERHDYGMTGVRTSQVEKFNRDSEGNIGMQYEEADFDWNNRAATEQSMNLPHDGTTYGHSLEYYASRAALLESRKKERPRYIQETKVHFDDIPEAVFGMLDEADERKHRAASANVASSALGILRFTEQDNICLVIDAKNEAESSLNDDDAIRDIISRSKTIDPETAKLEDVPNYEPSSATARAAGRNYVTLDKYQMAAAMMTLSDPKYYRRAASVSDYGLNRYSFVEIKPDGSEGATLIGLTAAITHAAERLTNGDRELVIGNVLRIANSRSVFETSDGYYKEVSTGTKFSSKKELGSYLVARVRGELSDGSFLDQANKATRDALTTKELLSDPQNVTSDVRKIITDYTQDSIDSLLEKHPSYVVVGDKEIDTVAFAAAIDYIRSGEFVVSKEPVIGKKSFKYKFKETATGIDYDAAGAIVRAVNLMQNDEFADTALKFAARIARRPGVVKALNGNIPAGSSLVNYVLDKITTPVSMSASSLDDSLNRALALTINARVFANKSAYHDGYEEFESISKRRNDESAEDYELRRVAFANACAEADELGLTKRDPDDYTRKKSDRKIESISPEEISAINNTKYAPQETKANADSVEETRASKVSRLANEYMSEVARRNAAMEERGIYELLYGDQMKEELGDDYTPELANALINYRENAIAKRNAELYANDVLELGEENVNIDDYIYDASDVLASKADFAGAKIDEESTREYMFTDFNGEIGDFDAYKKAVAATKGVNGFNIAKAPGQIVPKWVTSKREAEYFGNRGGKKYGREMTKGKRVSALAASVLAADVTKQLMATEKGTEFQAKFYDRVMNSDEFSFDVNETTTNNAMRRMGFAKVETGGGTVVDLPTWKGKVNGGRGISLYEAEGYIVEGIQLFGDLMKMGDIDNALDVAAELRMLATESGRNTQVFKLLKAVEGYDTSYYISKYVDRLNKRIYKKKIDAGQMEAIQIDAALMRGLAAAQVGGDSQQILAAEKAVMQDIADQLPLTIAETINNWRYLCMLANPVTHARNFIGNAFMRGLKIGKDAIGSKLEDVAIGKGLMTQSEATHKTYQKSEQSDLINYAKELYEANSDEIGGGGRFGFETQIARMRKGSNVKLANEAMKFNDRLLNDIEDGMFLSASFVDSFVQYCVRHNISVADMKANDLDEINEKAQKEYLRNSAMQYAMEEAQKATFHDASELANMLNRVQKMNAASELIVGGLVPFKKTPINIMKRGFEYSPIALVQGGVELGKAILNSNGIKNKFTGKEFNTKLTTAKAIDKVASGTVGTALLAIGAFLAKAGILRAAGGDEDEQETKYLNKIGVTTYSMVFGSVSVDLSNFAPSTIPLFMGVELYDMASKIDGEDFNAGDFFTNVLGMVEASANPFMEMTLMSSVESALDSYKYGGTNSVAEALIAQGISGYIGQLTPTIGAKIADVTDPYERTTAGYGNSVAARNVDSFIKQQINKIPGAEATLPKSIGINGQVKKWDGFGDWALDFANSFILPGKITVRSRAESDNEIIRLHRETGNTDIFPTAAQKYINVNFRDGRGSVRVRFTSKEYEQYAQEYGQSIYSAIDDLINSSYYKSMDDDMKAITLSTRIDNAKSVVNNRWKQKIISDRK